MIWLSIVSLLAGALLAHRFKVIALVPATIVVAVVAVGAGLAQTKGVWSILLMIAIASVGMQVGYFVGMMIQHGLGALLERKSSPFADTTSARNPARYRP
jgi:membrane protein DedA with SNARE-associated domain